MKIRTIILVLLAAATLASCTKQVDFDPGDVSPYVVMVSKPVSDSVVTVYVGFSRFFLDNNPMGSVDDAVVTLTVGGVTTVGVYDTDCFMSRLSYDDDSFYDEWSSDTVHYGGYAFQTRPQPGDTLKLRAEVPGAAAVEARTVVPRQPWVEITDYVADTIRSSYYNSNYVRYRVNVRVHSYGDDYYCISFSMPEARGNDAIGYYWDTTRVYSVAMQVDDPIVNDQSLGVVFDEGDNSFYGNEMYFGTDMFVGGVHDFTIDFDDWSYSYGLDVTEKPIRMQVRALSRDLYLYDKTLAASKSEFTGLFSEPVQVYCNVEGGIGIVGASTTKVCAMPRARVEDFYSNDKKGGRR